MWRVVLKIFSENEWWECGDAKRFGLWFLYFFVFQGDGAIWGGGIGFWGRGGGWGSLMMLRVLGIFYNRGFLRGGGGGVGDEIRVGKR